MALLAPNRSSMPNVSNKSSMMNAAALRGEPKSKRNRRAVLPRITLPIAILAIATIFASPTVAVDSSVLPEITPSASLDQTQVLVTSDDTRLPIAIPTTMPSTSESLQIGVKRDGKSEGTSTSYQTKVKRSSTTVTKVTEASRSTTQAVETPLPSPFDNPVPSAFQIPGGGDSCPNYIASLLSDTTFKSCYPISMLIQTSTSFFEAEKTLVGIVRVLDATCAADVTKCTDFLNKAAQNLTTAANCKTEFEQNQTQVLQAWRALRAYKVLYSATCLQDPSSSSYCFANAITNLSTPSDAYLYFMPYGLALPGASTPSCNWCIQKTMSVYYLASADRNQFVALKYEDAARQINTLCGPNFVNSTLPPAESGAISMVPSRVGVAASTLFTIFLFAWFI